MVLLSNAFNPLERYRLAIVGDAFPGLRSAAWSCNSVARGATFEARPVFSAYVCVCSSMLQLYRNGRDAQKVSYGRWASISGATNESREPKLPVAGSPSGIRDRDPNPSAAAVPGPFRGTKTWHS